MKMQLHPLIILLFCMIPLSAQNVNFTLSEYQKALQSFENQSLDDFRTQNNSGKYLNSVGDLWSNALYSDSMEIKFNLTSDEISLLQKHGFVVTERQSREKFEDQFNNVYIKDLPVYISSDAILFALHHSYNNILMHVESQFLIPNLKLLLENMRNDFPQLATKYSGNTELKTSLIDIDVYLGVSLMLLTGNYTPVFSESQPAITEFIEYIENEEMKPVKIFADELRNFDFSQFTVRGHYTFTQDMSDYFKTMIWLGRTELYLIAPENVVPEVSFATEKRQILDALLIRELCAKDNSFELYKKIERAISLFIGDQDNVKVENLSSLLETLDIDDVSQFTDSLKIEELQNELINSPFAEQKILSQVLIRNPMSPEKIKPASAFMLFGQRFIIDSYITGSVVYDKINSARLLPSTLDVLFALGNDAANQLLQGELEQYKYWKELSALRYLVDGYTSEFWDSSIYNLWLNSIRKLNPPNDRSNLPNFMQSAAWWQKMMNTQLASWTELRHDNILYSKQSYTGGIGCSFPYGYVEPVPDFFSQLMKFTDKTKSMLNEIEYDFSYINSYWDKFYGVIDTLKVISEKELSGLALSESEKNFLKRTITKNPEGVCGENPFNGWFMDLLYPGLEENNNAVVADYHTAPTDEAGNMVGFVAHAGTGDIDLAIITANLPGVGNVAFAGPVSSYHEYVTTGFKRLTDEEWRSEYLIQSTRPDWANLYLANKNGLKYEEGRTLITGVNTETESTLIPQELYAANYPNPFNPTTTITFRIPNSLSNKNVDLTIYSITGEKIITLVNNELPANLYFVKWNGKDSFGVEMSSGIYLYKLESAGMQFTGKMNLLK
ncbi:MAG: DUF3160 domain-containing protein [Melioribacteraceae bacterium]|nr:DUF3160 domain-containing protein [Melioribacteraceae bacterium]